MKHQTLFSLKDKSKKKKKIKCHLLLFLFCTLRVKATPIIFDNKCKIFTPRSLLTTHKDLMTPKYKGPYLFIKRI